MTTYYRSQRTGLYYDGPGGRNVVPDPTAIRPAAPFVAWGTILFVVGSVLVAVGAAIPPITTDYGVVTNAGATWVIVGAMTLLVGGTLLTVGTFRAAVGIDTSHRLARWNAIKDRVEDIDQGDNPLA